MMLEEMTEEQLEKSYREYQGWYLRDKSIYHNRHYVTDEYLSNEVSDILDNLLEMGKRKNEVRRKV